MTSGQLAIRPRLALGLILLMCVGQAGCGRKSDNNPYGRLAPSINSGDADGRFGSRFEKASRADPNSEPMNVVDGDLPPADPTKEPVQIN